MPLQQRRRGVASPRRAMAATVSAVSVFVLVLFALAQPALALSPRRFAPKFKRTDDADDPLLSKARAAAAGDKYLLGVGKADITGPVVEINFAGYANPEQVGSGVRQRLYSRAFIVGEVDRPENRFVYLVLDTMSGDTAVRNGILEGLAALGPDYSVYGQSNVAVTGTHSHSGPGGWFNYLLPQITSLGFDRQGYQAIVDGAVLSIKRAHESLQEVRPAMCVCVCVRCMVKRAGLLTFSFPPGLPRLWHDPYLGRQHQPEPVRVPCESRVGEGAVRGRCR